MLDTQDILNGFFNTLQSSVDKVYDGDTLSEYLKEMSLETPTLVYQIVNVGAQYDIVVTNKKDLQPIDADKFIILYYWMEEAKNFMILWRDILLEGTKAFYYQLDGSVEHITVKKMLDQSKSVLQESIHSLQKVYPTMIANLGSDPKKVKRQVLNWEKQINPWTEYSIQFKAIAEQCRSISKLGNQLDRSNGSYKTIKRILKSYVDKRMSNMKEISYSAIEALNTIKDISNDEGKPNIIQKLQKIESVHKRLNELFVDVHHLEQIEKILEDMADTLEVAIDGDNGKLNVKKLSLKKSTQQWLESEIYLSFYEVEEVENQLKNKLKMILVNIQNYLTLLKNDSAENKGTPFRQAIEKFENEYHNIATKHRKLIDSASDKLEYQFNISQLFNNERLFLPLSVQSSLGNIDLDQTKLRHKVTKWLKKSFSFYTNLRKKAEKERTLSPSEKLVRYVDSRQFAEDNRQYINIFLVKGYIGESFVIGRQEELDHFKSVYDNWRQGYRGSIVITGQRFSGKSLFAEYANIKVLNGKTIQLKPNMEYEINGRTFTSTYNLKETLGNITKHHHDTKPAIFIDDIELWYDKEVTLSSNIRELTRIIDKYSSKIFFVVTMSNWLQYKMNSVYGINSVFQADINLDRMSLEEIRQIISIRQGATYKELLNPEERKITEDEFNKITRRLHHNVDGNVGDALSKWAADTKYHDVNSVIMTNVLFQSIPDIDHKDTLLLLETIITARKTNEFYLHKFFGEAFKEKYSTLLQRLINVGLVTRNVDNLIQINPKVVNEVGQLLERKHYLTFNHR